MELKTDILSLDKKMVQAFEENREIIFKNDSSTIAARRVEAIESFKKTGFPNSKTENWRNTDISKTLKTDYNYYLEPDFQEHINLEKLFQCDIPHLQTNMISQLNGWFISKNGAISPASSNPEM